MMNGLQIKLVQDSFRRIAPVADLTAKLFYQRLFELDASLEPLFTGDMVEQGRKLMQMLRLLVNSLDRLDQFLPAVRVLGARHVAYGVRDRDYDTVGRALLWTLKQDLDGAFTPAVEAAWGEVYATLAAAMQGGSVAAQRAGALAHTL